MFRPLRLILPLLALFPAGLLSAENNVPAAAPPLIINVRDYGAIGDGKADDTAAIEKAWAVVMDAKKPQFHHPKSNQRGYVTVNPALYFPGGVYRYTGKGLEAGKGPQCWQVKGDGFNSARIEIESNVYFITCDRVESTIIEGLSFVGGKGVFRSTYQSVMVGGKHIFRNCYFLNYTECAIGNNAVDSPYLAISDCIFKCFPGAEGIGIAWGGYADDSQIERCAFERNAYHIKLGDRLSGSFQIGPRNSFISFGGTKTKADIWIVPNREAGRGINSGQGSLITDNKFGNENVDRTSPRILVAAEDENSGIDRLTRKPSQTSCGEGRQVTGFKLRDNLFMGSQGMQRGIVYSRVPHTAITFDHNYHVGAPYPYLIEFAPDIKSLPDRAPGINAMIYPQERDNGEKDLFPTQLCNLPGYAVALDPLGVFSGANETPLFFAPDDDPSFLPLASLPAGDIPLCGKATTRPAKDPRGMSDAVEVNITAPESGLELKLDGPNKLQAGRLGFIEIELKAANDKSLDRVYVMLLNKACPEKEIEANLEKAPSFLGNKKILWQKAFSRCVKLQPYWQKVCLPFTLRDVADSDFRLAIISVGYDPNELRKDARENFVCGNVKVYHAKSTARSNRGGVKTVEDQDLAFCPGVDPEQIVYTGTLSKERTVSLVDNGTIKPLAGAKFKVARPAAGGALLKVGNAGTLAAGEWCEAVWTGKELCIVAKGKLQ